MLVGLVLGFALVAGCKQPCYVTECDLDHYRQIGLSQQLECLPADNIAAEADHIPAPTTVLDPDRQPRFVTLQECIATSLERGTVGSASALFPGIASDQLVSFAGTAASGDDSIRALALDPAVIETNIESSLAKFDARWITSLSWGVVDRPVGTALDTFQTLRTNVSTLQEDLGSFSSALVKPLPTGGVAGITFNMNYQLSNTGQRVNPSWQPEIQVGFEQPLLQGFGIDINQLRSTHPGANGGQISGLPSFPTGGRAEGILITRIRFDQARAEFERNLNFAVVNVEFAYWTLYGSYWTLYSREQALRQAFEAWRINKARYDAGRIPIQDLAQSRGQYELFRGQRITALGQVLENERQLRGLMGLPIEDCTRLIPIDQPSLALYVPDWCTGLSEAMNLRPELVIARQDLKFRQLDLIVQKNQLLPDLRFFSSYDVNALGSKLDGSDFNGAFHNLGLFNFNSWNLGLRLDVPIGFRDAHSLVRAARLSLARSYVVLRDQELKLQRSMAFAYRRIFEFYEQIGAQRAQREAYAEQLAARFKEFLAGRGTLDFLLESQRNWADALRAEYDAIVQYNNALALYQFQKGTILAYDNVAISEGPLPKCAQVRAAEHQAERAKALVLRERPLPQQPICCGAEGCSCDHDPLMKSLGPTTALEGQPNITMPVLPDGAAPTLPSLFKDAPPLPNNAEPLPAPQSKVPVSSRVTMPSNGPPADLMMTGVPMAPGVMQTGGMMPMPAGPAKK